MSLFEYMTICFFFVLLSVGLYSCATGGIPSVVVNRKSASARGPNAPMPDPPQHEAGVRAPNPHTVRAP